MEFGTPIRSLPEQQNSMQYLSRIIFAILMLWLAACQSQPEQASQTASNLTVLYARSTPEFDAFVEHALQIYGKEHNIATLSKACSILEMLTLAMDTANPLRPDVLILPYEYIPTLAASACLLPHGPARRNAISSMSSACMWNGKIYGALLTCELPMLVVNKNLAQPGLQLDRGLTVSDIMQVSEVANNYDGTVWGVHGEDPGALIQTIITWFAMFGGSVLDTNGQPVVNSVDNVRALTSYAELAQGTKMETRRQLRAECAQGKVGLWYTTSTMYRSLSASRPQTELDVSFVTEKEGSIQSNALLGTAACIAATTSDPTMSRELIDYLQREIAEQSTIGYTSSSTFWSTMSNSGNAINQRLYQHVATGHTIRSSPQWLAIQTIVEHAVMRVLYGQTTALEALNQAQAELMELNS